MEPRRYAWAGTSTRYWLFGDHGPWLTYLARASWDAPATLESVYRDQLNTVCSEPRIDPIPMFVCRDGGCPELLELGQIGSRWNRFPGLSQIGRESRGTS